MEVPSKAPRNEVGQALILFSLMIGVLFLCAMAVVDVGFFLHNRELAQQTADAAALAGAQDLPGNPTLAQSDALQYVTKNGMSTANTTVTFRCTSQNPFVCTTGSGTYDTILVTQKASSPTYFGGILGVLGFSNCWVQGCTASASAAGCRGACGGPITNPLDVVLIMDRTGSMTASDMTNAKTGALSILQLFNPNYQRVALGVLGPSNTSSTCGAPNSGGLGIAASSGGSWVPVGFSTDYQNSNGTLNTSSLIVKTINCLNNSSVGTNLGDPVLAAKNYLAANGRAGVKQAIILETDGEATAANPGTVSTSTGALNCTVQAAVTSSAGDNNGYETNAADACVAGGLVAQDANSGTGTSTSCTSTAKDKHKFSSFGLSVPASPTPTINGIEIKLNAWASAGATTRTVCVELSWNNGASWTTAKTAAIGSSNAQQTLGTPTDSWGHTWSASELSNANFLVRVTDVASNTSTTFNLDGVTANVYYTYTDPALSNSGPCDFAAKQAAAAKAVGIEIFTIGFGVEGARCSSDSTGSPYYNVLATNLLAAMATLSTDDGGDGPGGLPPGCNTTAEQDSENADGDHFLCEAKNSSLTPIFQSAGKALASGSRLVP